MKSMRIADIPSDVLALLRRGTVIPAVPLALNGSGGFDGESQRALLRYYVDSRAGGMAIGVHSTQFAIRDIPGFYGDLLSFAAETTDSWSKRRGEPFIKIAGICGRTDQAVAEAAMAAEKGYHAGLLSLSALAGEDEKSLLEHVKTVSWALPVVGFYLQPAVGGIPLSYRFWRDFASLDNVVAIKIAPFDRYATLDVLRGVADSERPEDVALYTGNDDTIVADLLTGFRFAGSGGKHRTLRIVGGLLGHWGVWTSKAVEMFQRIREIVQSGEPIPPELLTLAQEVTDMNAALFDVAHHFDGCLPGIHEVLRRQGLMKTGRCLDPEEVLSPGQTDEIERVCRAYPHLTDDKFVRENLSLWRS